MQREATILNRMIPPIPTDRQTKFGAAEKNLKADYVELARVDNNASSTQRVESLITPGTILYVGDFVLVEDEEDMISLAQVLSLFGKSLKKPNKSKKSKKSTKTPSDGETELDPTATPDPPMKKGQLSKDTHPFKSLVKLRFFNRVSKEGDFVLFEDETNPVWQYQPTKDVLAVIPPCRVSSNRVLLSVKVKV